MLTTPPLVIVGCGATKHPTRAPAGQMYLGGYHRACRRVAAQVTNPARTRILSALHGLLTLDAVIDPYDLRMGQPGSTTVDQVRAQAASEGLLDAETVIVLAGSAYANVVKAVWPHAHTPLAGVGGLGKQLAALAKMADQPRLALPYVPPTPGPGLIRPGVAVEAIPEVAPKTGGRYGGTLVAVTGRTAVVDCHDGYQRRFPTEHLLLNHAQMLLDAWHHLGYIDPTTGRPTTDWEWLDWTIADHLHHVA